MKGSQKIHLYPSELAVRFQREWNLIGRFSLPEQLQEQSLMVDNAYVEAVS
jgi:hypothetical protein